MVDRGRGREKEGVRPQDLERRPSFAPLLAPDVDPVTVPLQKAHRPPAWVAPRPLLLHAFEVRDEPVVVADAVEDQFDLEAGRRPAFVLAEQEGIPVSTGPSGVFPRKEVRTRRRMSLIARSRFDLPEALAPKIPAHGRTPTGLPSSRHSISRTTRGSESLVESSESSNGSRKERAFWPRKVSSIEPFWSARRPAPSTITAPVSRKTGERGMKAGRMGDPGSFLQPGLQRSATRSGGLKGVSAVFLRSQPSSATLYCVKGSVMPETGSGSNRRKARRWQERMRSP